MIIKIKKALQNSPEDFAVRSEIGEVICKIARLKKGYYIYNKTGEQIAQVTFDKNTANLVIAGSAAGATKMARFTSDNFSFNEDASANAKEAPALSIWGDTATYNYNIFSGSKVAASVVPSSSDTNCYMIKIGEAGNLLKIIMVAIAAERLNNNPMSKA